MSNDMLVSLRALIVDDQRTMRSIVRTLLSQIGITDVVEAADGTEAIEIIEMPGETVPDFVICDLHMKDGDAKLAGWLVSPTSRRSGGNIRRLALSS